MSRTYIPKTISDVYSIRQDKKKSIVVLMPTYKWVPTETFSSFFHLLWKLRDNYNLTFKQVENTLIGHARDELVRKAVTEETRDADYVLWCDSDHIFKYSDFEELVASLEYHKIDIISGLYFTRRVDYVTPVAMMKKDNGAYGAIMEIPPKVVMPIDATGLGFCLMRYKILQEIYSIDKHPFTSNNTFNVGEDILFFEKIKKLGYKLHLNTAVIVRHCGSSIGIEEYNLYKGLRGE